MNPSSYRCILADPPWPEHGGGRIRRGANQHYQRLKPWQILEVMLGAEVWRPDADSHQWLWVTNNWLPAGLMVIESLGFRYITNAVWVKEGKGGIGQYLRGRHELLLFDVRGTLPYQSKSVTTVIEAPLREHSTKPEETYTVIEAVSPGPRLEMFARRRRQGWDVWSTEVGSRISPPSPAPPPRKKSRMTRGEDC